MQHSYDLLLQGEPPGDAAWYTALVAALTARGATLDAEGRGGWKLPEGELTVGPLFDDGVKKGLDVRVPFQGDAGLLEAAVKVLADVATERQVRLMDPQRNEVASVTALGSITDEYLRMARYAGEYGGVGEALGLTSYARPDESDGSSLRWLMALAVFAFALYAGWRTVVTLRASRDAAEEEAELQRVGTPLPAQPPRKK